LLEQQAAVHLPDVLSLSCISISEFSAAQLAQGKWPQLKTIVASSCCLSTHKVLDILDGNWQNLEVLDVSSNSTLSKSLDTEAISLYLGFARNYLMHGLNRLTDPRPAGSLPHLQVIDLSW